MTAKPRLPQSIHRIAAGTAAVLAAAVATGCAPFSSAAPPASEESQTLSPEEFTAAQGRLELLLPSLEQDAGQFVDLDLIVLREESCLRYETEEEQTQTRWLGELSGYVADLQAANAALDAVRASLQADGWTLLAEESTADEENGRARVMDFEKEGLSVTARFERADLVSDWIVVFATTGCVDHPDEHQMLRSPLDPDYGNSSQYYPDGA